MPSYTVFFEKGNVKTMLLPSQLLLAGGEYLLEIDSTRGVQIRGNREGLLYLAEVLVRAAIGGHGKEFHVHLPLDSRDAGPNIDDRPELTIFASQDLSE